MIFIILGTQKFQLNRLLKMIDCICAEGKVTDVFAQIGHSDYIPQNYEYVDFMDKVDFENKIKQSSLVITHSGVGSIITAVRYHIPVIVFPRLKKYKEHVDDHQLEIAKAFEKKNLVLCYDESDDLCDLIEKAKVYQFNEYKSTTENVINVIKEFIEEI